MDSRIDVVLLTKNSERKLQECVDSIYSNIPVARLIAVDGYSKDKTLDILGEFNRKYRNVKVIMDKGTRATALQKGIEAVETDWFVFVDSDVAAGCADSQLFQPYLLTDRPASHCN